MLAAAGTQGLVAGLATNMAVGAGIGGLSAASMSASDNLYDPKFAAKVWADTKQGAKFGTFFGGTFFGASQLGAAGVLGTPGKRAVETMGNYPNATGAAIGGTFEAIGTLASAAASLMLPWLSGMAA